MAPYLGFLSPWQWLCVILLAQQPQPMQNLASFWDPRVETSASKLSLLPCAGWQVLSRWDGHHVRCTMLSCPSTSSTHAREGWTNLAAQGGLQCPVEGLQSHLQHHLPSPHSTAGEPS